MPEKTAKNGQRYKVDGKKFVWFPLDDNDEMGNLPEVVLPLRIKFGLIRSMLGADDDVAGQVAMLDKIAPTESEKFDEMDVNDIAQMFNTWQVEYQAMSGATLGE